MSYYEQWQQEKFGNVINDQWGDGTWPIETTDQDTEDQRRKVEEIGELQLMEHQ